MCSDNNNSPSKGRVTRFRKSSYAGKNSAGDIPRWHVAVYAYRKGEPYKSYEALCGYTIEWPCFENLPVLLSIAKKVNDKNPHCALCLKRMADLGKGE